MANSGSVALKLALRSITGMERVEQRICSQFRSDLKRLSEIPQYLFDLGGKRIRPVLTLLIEQLFSDQASPSEEVIEVCAGIELIHMATLLHDDIIDRSPLRRHQTSPYLRYGTDSTLLAGDFLLVRAFSLCAHLDSAVIQHTEQACVELVEGEMLELPLHQARASLDDALKIADRKTAALFDLAAWCGAHLTEHGRSQDALCGQIGRKLGVAFQILDDILDVTSSDDVLGKRSGLDLLERKPSVVNVLWLEEGSTVARRLCEPPGQNEEAFRIEALEAVRKSTALLKARELAVQYARQSKELLHSLPTPLSNRSRDAVRAIEQLVEFVVERVQ